MVTASIFLAIICPAVLCTTLSRIGLTPTTPSGARLGSIDGLRGYLALLVVIHHFAVWQVYAQSGIWDLPANTFLANAGSGGVALFFMVSGALFYAILDNRSGHFPFIPIYTSRIFRITPLLWTAVSALFAIGFYRGGSLAGIDIASGLRWMFLLGMPQMMDSTISREDMASVLWTLRWEWIFYLSLPAIAFFQRSQPCRGNRLAFIFALCAVVMLARGAGFGPRPPSFFILGVLAIEIAKCDKWAKLLRYKSVAIATIPFGVIAFCSIPSIYSPLGGILLFVIFLPIVAGNDWFGLLSANFSRTLGEASYGIYLLHGIVLSVTFHDIGLRTLPEPNRWIYLPIITTATAVISLATFVAIERPAIRLGKNVSYRLSQVLSKAPAYPNCQRTLNDGLESVTSVPPRHIP